MRFARVYTIAFLALLAVPALYAQESHVQHRYVKDTKLTVVTSDALYVINMPTQFMALQLRGSYPDQDQPPKRLPDKISLEFSSYTTEPLYRNDESHRLAVKADEDVLDFGLLSYVALQENGKDTYARDKTSALVIRSPIPPDALVRTTHPGKGLTLETMSATNVPLDQITKMANARQVLMKIGNTVFALTATQMSILREFAASITPANAESLAAARTPTNAAASVPSSVPSDSNNASLDVTLRWLKKELSQNSSLKGAGVPARFEAVDFSGCKIKYRMYPALPTVPGGNSRLSYGINEYQLNLADLNPESVRDTDLKDYALIFFETRDHEPKIKQVVRLSEEGHAGRPLDEKQNSGGSFTLRDAEAASQIRAAFVHAIKLCQAQP